MTHWSAGIYSWQCRIQAEVELVSLSSSLKLKHKPCNADFCLHHFRVSNLPCILMQRLMFTWLHFILPKEQGKEGLYSHKNEKSVSFKREIHSVYLAFVISEESHRSLTVRNVHFEGRHVMPPSSVCLLVHNRTDFPTWECFGVLLCKIFYSLFLLKPAHQQPEASVLMLPFMEHHTVPAVSADWLSFKDRFAQKREALF